MTKRRRRARRHWDYYNITTDKRKGVTAWAVTPSIDWRPQGRVRRSHRRDSIVYAGMTTRPCGMTGIHIIWSISLNDQARSIITWALTPMLSPWKGGSDVFSPKSQSGRLATVLSQLIKSRRIFEHFSHSCISVDSFHFYPWRRILLQFYDSDLRAYHLKGSDI